MALNGGHQELGFASVGELAEELGLSAREGRMLCALGRALEGWPGLEERVRDGRCNPEKGAAFARLLDVPAAVRPGDDWLGAAEEEPTTEFLRRVGGRVEETLRGVPVERLSFWVSQGGMADFRHCRALASRRAQRRLSRGETLEVVAARFLEAEDPLRAGKRRRRAGATAGTPGRHVPAEVRRAVLGRARSRCEFPRCGLDTWLDFAHLRAHRHGGSREADNLLLLCGVHHRALDAGLLRVRVEGGRLRFRLPGGQEREGPRLAPEVPVPVGKAVPSGR